jgi:hypothetical protein
MRGSCGKCGQTFDGQMLCPQCGIQLQDEGEGTMVPLPVSAPNELPDGPSFLRRCALGGITLVGLFHGLKHVVLAGMLVQSGAAALSPEGLLVLVGLAAFGAAVVGGTVNRRAEVTGLLLGAGAAAGLVGPDLVRGGQPPDEWLVGVPAGLMLLGVVGGFAGRLMMPPAPVLPQSTRIGLAPRVAAPARRVPLSWLRILLGAGVVVAGTVYADGIRGGLSYVLAGHGGSFGAGRLVTWQITVIVAVAGGFTAGANTRRGLRQGCAAGLLAASVVAFAAALDHGPSLVLEFWMDQLGDREVRPVTFAALGATAWVGTAVGGWLGGQLLPTGRANDRNRDPAR